MTAQQEATRRRMDAYIDMLKEAYQVDNNGLADIAGINRGTFTKFMKADWGDKSVSVLVKLMRLTGISPSYLYAEDVDDAEAVA